MSLPIEVNPGLPDQGEETGDRMDKVDERTKMLEQQLTELSAQVRALSEAMKQSLQ